MRVSTYNTYIHTYLSLRDNSFSRRFNLNKVIKKESLCQVV